MVYIYLEIAFCNQGLKNNRPKPFGIKGTGVIDNIKNDCIAFHRPCSWVLALCMLAHCLTPNETQPS